jgi:hypothetical protein
LTLVILKLRAKQFFTHNIIDFCYVLSIFFTGRRYHLGGPRAGGNAFS